MGTEMRSRKMILLSAVLAVFALGAVVSASASASPQWHFGGTTLSESEAETVVGAAFSSSLKVEGAATTCEHFLYNMEAWNFLGTGEALVWELPLFSCTTTAPGCTVSSIEAEELPWWAHLETVAGKPYLRLEDIDVKIVYGGGSCSLGTIHLKGTAGGVIDNANSTATFDKATFEATHSSLKVGAKEVEWTGEFPMEAFEGHRLDALEAF
jgi:hypothetical protein